MLVFSQSLSLSLSLWLFFLFFFSSSPLHFHPVLRKLMVHFNHTLWLSILSVHHFCLLRSVSLLPLAHKYDYFGIIPRSRSSSDAGKWKKCPCLCRTIRVDKCSDTRLGHWPTARSAKLPTQIVINRGES